MFHNKAFWKKRKGFTNNLQLRNQVLTALPFSSAAKRWLRGFSGWAPRMRAGCAHRRPAQSSFGHARLFHLAPRGAEVPAGGFRLGAAEPQLLDEGGKAVLPHIPDDAVCGFLRIV